MGQRLGRMKTLKLLCRKAGRLVHLPLLYEIAFQDTLMERCEDGVIYRVSVLRDTTVRQIKGLIRKCSKEKKALVLMFHSIDASEEDNWTWNSEKLGELCQYLAIKRDDGDIELCTTEQAVRLMQK